MRIDTLKKYQLWTYSDGCYHLKEFDTLGEALEEDKYGSNFYITRSVSFDVIEKIGWPYDQIRSSTSITSYSKYCLSNMPNITETISLLDELRGKATQGEWNPITEITGRIWTGYKGSADSLSVLMDSDSEYIIALHNNYEALRQAALDGERYRKAGEELVRNITECGHDMEKPECGTCAALIAYRQAVEQKEV